MLMRRVAVLIESSRAYGRGLLRGVARYNREHGHWSVYLQPHGLDDPPPRWLNRWRGDGILVRIGDRRMLRAVLGAGLPTVDLRGVVPDLGIPFIGVDNRAVADMAGDHLMERGLRHFGFCGLPAGVHPHLDERRRFFTARIDRSGYEVHFYEAKAEQSTPWDREQRRMAAWISRLPKPVGIMTCHDDRGLQALDACQAAGVSVPDEVAIISVDDDELLCSMFTPQLSSIDVNPERIGYRAAELLDRMMAGEPPVRDPILLPPRGVVLRQSTDTLAVDDPAIAAALRHIRCHACEGLLVDDLLDQIHLSRSVLERRFHRIVGRSPKAEIFRVQLQRAKQLLSESNLSIDVVAGKTGFRDGRYLCDVFARKVRMTPRTYREQMRRESPSHPHELH
jgi:LacI family transcriptional regulator